MFVSLNLLYFPGVTDCEEEIAALTELVNACGVNFIQLRNLNIDPELYLNLLDGVPFGPSTGLANFRKRLRKACPGLRLVSFNPAVDGPRRSPPPEPALETPGEGLADQFGFPLLPGGVQGVRHHPPRRRLPVRSGGIRTVSGFIQFIRTPL